MNEDLTRQLLRRIAALERRLGIVETSEAGAAHSHSDYLNRDGSVALTADWDIGDTRKLSADTLAARDAAGLSLQDDGGNVGVFVEDGGNVGLGGVTDPGVAVHIAGGGVSIKSGDHPSFQNDSLNMDFSSTLSVGRLQAGGSTKRSLVINPAGGNVGINTNVADDALQIGNATARERVRIEGNEVYALGMKNGTAGIYAWMGVTTAGDYQFSDVGGNAVLTITQTGRLGLKNVTSPLGVTHIDQSSTTAAIPVLILDQADLSEEFIEFTATVGAGNPIDTAAVGTYYGKIRVNVTGVGYKYIALYNS